MISAVNSRAPVWSFSLPSGDGVTLISKDCPSSRMEIVLGAISTASTATGRPSSITRQPEASRSSSMTWFFCSEGDASWTSYLMAGGPVARDGLPASSERAGLRKKRTDKNVCPTGLPARMPRRRRRHQRRSLRADFGPQETRRNADGGATRQATWCAPRRGEDRDQQG